MNYADAWNPVKSSLIWRALPLINVGREAYKQELYDSRIYVTRQLVHAINTRRVKPELFISASAVGYYPAFGEYDEYHDYRGMDFLARLCGAWEEEASACSSDVRLVITRLGVVLSEDGGALKEMLRLQLPLTGKCRGR